MRTHLFRFFLKAAIPVTCFVGVFAVADDTTDKRAQQFNETIQELTTPTNTSAFAKFLGSYPSEGRSNRTNDAIKEVRVAALKKLYRQNDPAAVKYIAPLLYEKNWVEDFQLPPQVGDVIIGTPAMAAAEILWLMKLPQAPPTKNLYDFHPWQRWWEQHKDYYEKVEFGKPLPPLPVLQTATNSLKTQSNPVSPLRTPQSTASESTAPSASWLYPLIIIGVVLGGFVAWLLVRRRGKS